MSNSKATWQNQGDMIRELVVAGRDVVTEASPSTISRLQRALIPFKSVQARGTAKYPYKQPEKKNAQIQNHKMS